MVAAITPWNSPLLLLTWKLAPALAAGCTVVVKPSEHSPAATLELARLIGEAGFPPGVVNVVTGASRELGAALAGHPGVDKVAFTGSTATGRAVAHAAAENLNKVTLELGGKSPQIVFADADLDAAANGVIAGVFAATGQTCMAGSRLIVHADVHDELVERVVRRAQAIKLGDPTDPAHRDGTGGQSPAVREGPAATCRPLARRARWPPCGGEPDERLGGLFVKPTVFTGVDPEATVVREEVFGPVLAVLSFSDEAEADPARQRHPVRAGRSRLDQGRAPSPSRRRPSAGRDGLDQRLSRRSTKRPLRRFRALGPGTRERARRSQRVPRAQVGLGRADRRHA